jgi:hypothetical protein
MEGMCTHLRTTPTGMGFNLANGYAWLTSARLIMKPQIPMNAGPVKIRFSPVAYPLSHIVETAILPIKVGFSNRNVLRLTFDNGGKEYFDFAGKPEEWQVAVLRAQPGAPALPYETVPAVKAGVEGAGARAWKMLALLVGGLIACGCIGSLVLAALAGK